MAKILLIDDDELVRYSLTRVLQGPGHEVVQAPDGVEGLRLFRSAPPALVITDIVMPEQDGLGLISEIRKLDKRVPILVMSGGGDKLGTDFLVLAQLMGANAILAKPFDNAVLLGKIASLLQV